MNNCFNCFSEDVVKSISPFVDRIPAGEQSAYIEELVDYFVKENMVQDSDGQFRCVPPYKLMVAYAQKPLNKF